MAVKGDEVPARTRDGRLRTRLARLQAIAEYPSLGADQVSKAVTALKDLHAKGGRGLTAVRLRPTFIVRRQQPKGEMSDRRRPEGTLPPVLQLASPNGIAQQLEIVSLFVAQTHGQRRRDGRVTTLNLELDPLDAGEIGWIDVVVPHAGHNPVAVVAASRRDNRLRQVKHALTALESKGLVELPNSTSSRGKYDGFRLLDEGGQRPTGLPLPYRVPAANDGAIEIPIDFFLNGWVYVLSKSEIALWLMLRHLRGTPAVGSDANAVAISGADRVRRYGVSKDAYKGWWLLERAGLLDVEVDLMRRGDGTVEGFDPSNPPDLHSFRLQDDELAKPAAAAVKAAIAAAVDHEPMGVTRVNQARLEVLGLAGL